MKLTRLRLLGFKSFVEPTDFLIEPGLTGVVGPNGCGKSNLVEALRWVMGETSHKSMRAADMEDVIFAGTNVRPARNNAEVAMHIDNSSRKAPAQFNEHESLDVARRIEREKGSTYRINGREVRARDVQILFADASTGSRSPALVHQGRIGEIIQAKPEQRRRVLEEAAGISGLHARRHEAELRLRAAEQNLQRLEDVINQLSLADGGAEDAGAPGGALSQHRRRRCAGTEATLFHLRWLAANTELSEAEQAKNLAVRVVADAPERRPKPRRRQALAAAELPPLREAEAARRRRAAAAGHRARDARSRGDARQRAHRRTRPAAACSLTDDIERERKLAADAESRAGAARRGRARRCKQRPRGQGDSKRTGADARVAEADTVLAASEKTFGELTGTLADLTARRNALERIAREQTTGWPGSSDETRRRSRPNWPRSIPRPPAIPISRRSRSPPRRRRPRSPRRKPPRCAPRPRIPPRGRRSMSHAARSPRPSAAPTARHRGQDARQAAACRHQEPLAVGDRRSHGGEGLRGRARRRARRRSRSAGRSDRADALGRRRDRSGRSGAAGRRRGARRDTSRRRRNWRGGCAQIGVVARDDAPRLAPMLKPGQRLVSRDGDLWRWDGFSVAANAPTGAARRLAGKNRLADIEAGAADRCAPTWKRGSRSVAQAQADVAPRPRPRPPPARAGANCSTPRTPRASATPTPNAS